MARGIMMTARRGFARLALGLAVSLLLAACGGTEDEPAPVKARNLSTGEIQTFGSQADVPPDWTICNDATCTIPPQVPCDKLGEKVCTLQPSCRLKTLWCIGTGTVTPGGGSTTGTEKCEYACIPQLPLLCEELADQKSCAGRTDCEWLQGPCPAIACQTGQTCPPCPFSCQTKQPPLCAALDEQACKVRSDCEWDMPQACPACFGGPQCECKPSCKPATQPPPVVCDPAECGPAPGMPNKLCPDGKTVAGPTGKCLPTASGKCGWEVVSCPTVVPPTTCVRTGCSGTLCAAQLMASTCEWSDYYGCYNLAVCGATNGSCGWIQTPDFVACLAKYGKKP